MSKYHDAANVLKREAARFAAMNQAAEALDELGSIDQAATEAKARAVAHTKEAEAAKAEVDALKANALKMNKEQAAKMKEYDDIAAKAIYDANTKASEILSNAEAKAADTVARAITLVQGQTDAVAQQISSLEKMKANLSAECDQLYDKVQAFNVEADAAEKRLAKVKESIAKLAGI